MILEKGFSRAFEAFGKGQRLPRAIPVLSVLSDGAEGNREGRSFGSMVLSKRAGQEKILYLPDLSFFVSCFRDFGVETLRFAAAAALMLSSC
jgi:hypothetical protein